jgi:hypothetical protein
VEERRQGEHCEPDAAATRDGSMPVEFGSVRHRDEWIGLLLMEESERSARQFVYGVHEAIDDAGESVASLPKGQGDEPGEGQEALQEVELEQMWRF